MKSTKHTGVRVNILEDETKVYYIRYKHNGKDITQKVGTNKEGITPIYCKKRLNGKNGGLNYYFFLSFIK